MKLVNWSRFSWDLTDLPGCGSDLPEHYQIRLAAREDEKEIRKVIATAFALDSTWGDVIHDVTAMLDVWLKQAFEAEQISCLVLTHGMRIIGTAAVACDPVADTHLVPGPCVLMEYRNRGLGTALLAEALLHLRGSGLTEAFAISKDAAPVAKFLYPKFGGVAVPYEFRPLLAA